MDDADGVRVFERAQYLSHEIGGALGWKRAAALRELLERLALHELHHHQEIAIGVLNLVDRRNIGVMKTRQGGRFGLKMFHELAVTELRIQNFYRNFAIQRLVDRLVNGSQRAPAELLEESVFPDGFSDHVAADIAGCRTGR